MARAQRLRRLLGLTLQRSLHEPHVQGHRIRVRDIVAARDLGGYTPEEIARTVYLQLSLAEVCSALAYYEDHRSEIDAASAAEAVAVSKFHKQHPELVGRASMAKQRLRDSAS